MEASPFYLGSEQVGEDAVHNAGRMPLTRPDPLQRVTGLAYILFQRPELDKQKAFLQDFGMQVAADSGEAMFFRGHGSAPWFYGLYKGDKPRFLGAGYTLASERELQAVAAKHKLPIEPIDGPGGGQRVRLHDPNGFVVDFVFGREAAERLDCRSDLFDFNSPRNKSRVNRPVRSRAAPSPLEKLGHVVLGVLDFQESARWYMEHLGLIATDVQCVADGSPVLAFLRCDLGEEPADHHTVVLVQNIAPTLMHSAYETLDLDSIGQGAQHLKSKGWQHFWGIGRHILGSQLFDYWLDPYGDELEHYADGDVFTADHPTEYHPVDRGGLWTWGDDLPPMPGPPLSAIIKLLLGRGPRVAKPLLGQMRQALGIPARPWMK